MENIHKISDKDLNFEDIDQIDQEHPVVAQKPLEVFGKFEGGQVIGD